MKISKQIAKEKFEMLKADHAITLLDRLDGMRQIREGKISKKTVHDIDLYIQSHNEEARRQATWLELGLPEEVLLSAPDCVQLLAESHVAHFIVMFAHTIRLDDEKKPLLLMNGEWSPWSEITQQIEFDRHRECFVSKHDRSLCWNYISPSGFVQKDPNGSPLYPVAVLTKDEHRAVLEQAKSNACVLQIYTSTKDCVPPSWLTENALDLAAKHCACRLIDEEGRLYSFGLEITADFRKYMREHPKCCFSSGSAKLVMPDYAESMPFDRRYVTSIPITAERFEAIKQFASSVNAGPGITFSVLGTNCATFTKQVLEHAGVHVDLGMSLGEVVATGGPTIARVPVVGGMLSWLAKKISRIASLLLDNPVANVITFIPRTIVRMCLHGVMRLFGSQNPSLFFDHSYKLVQWQKRQGEATQEFFYSGKPKIVLFGTK